MAICSDRKSALSAVMAVVAFRASVALKTPVTTNWSSFTASAASAEVGALVVLPEGVGAVWARRRVAERGRRRETEKGRLREGRMGGGDFVGG
jgi:hypothetical protein